MMLILLFMGAFMDWVGIVLLIIPVFLPIVQRLPIEEIGLFGQLQPKYLAIWFGVVFCMNMQVQFLSPPFGPAAFYLKSVAPPHISLTDIFKGFLPFICIQLLALSVLLIWPPIIEILLEIGPTMLSAAQIASFHDNGYLVVEDVLGADVLDPVRSEYADLAGRALCGVVRRGQGRPCRPRSGFLRQAAGGLPGECDWFQPMDISLPGDRIAADTPMHFGPAVFDMVTAPRLLDLVEDLIGPEITWNPIQHVRIKPPTVDLAGRRGARAYHRDRLASGPRRRAGRGGPDRRWSRSGWRSPMRRWKTAVLQVLPKQGTQEMLPHCPRTQTGIAEGFVDQARAVPLPVRAGGAVIFHPLTPHASLVNTTDGFRWSFDLRYNVTGQPTGRAHFPEFVARSRAAPETELTDWREWRRMWEEARARLAETPHIDIHRWTSDAPYCA